MHKPLTKTLVLSFFLVGLILLSSLLTYNINAATTPKPWPPVVGQQYPNLVLIDQNGKKFKLSNFKRKVIVIEPMGMNCPACQAFSGANDIGAFQGNAVQKDLISFKKMVAKYIPSLRLPRKDVVFIQLLLYDMQMQAPKPEHAAVWAKHFGLSKKRQEIVAVSTQDLRGAASYNLIPGFQVIDKKFVLRSDSTGHNPKENLYSTLLPTLLKVIKE